jgi:hypothetical protein
MAVEINIEIGGGDDDDNNDDTDLNETRPEQDAPKKRRSRRKTANNPVDKLSDAAEKLAQSAASTPPPPPPQIPTSSGPATTGPLFTGTAPKKTEAEKLLEKQEKEFEREIRRQQQQIKREYIAEQQAEMRRIRETAQDEARQQREVARQQQAASQSSVGDIRSAAVAKRVQAYSAASLLGFPGYVGASALDQLVFRKQEAEQVAAEKKYQEDLRQYNLQLEQDRIARVRAQQQAVRDKPITAVDVTAARAAAGLPPDPSEGGGSPPGGNTLPGGSGGGNTPPGGGSNVPPPPSPPGGGNVPPPLPPSRQPPAQFDGTPFAIATAALLAAQQANKFIESGIQSAGQLGQGLTNTNASAGIKQSLKGAKNIVDPLGLNAPLTVAVEGFSQLLNISDGILASLQQNMAFSPATLQASVTGDIQKLVQQITLSRQLDPTTAELVRTNTTLEMAWAEFRANIIEDIGPEIISLLKLLTAVIHTADKARELGMLEFIKFLNPNIVTVLANLAQIAFNTAPKGKTLDDTDILQQIEDFLNPANYPNPGP